MIALHALATLLVVLLCEGRSNEIKCIHGDQAVCGNDGITYSNMCDLKIVPFARTKLTAVHEGPCNSLIKALIRILQMKQPRMNISGLRQRSRPKLLRRPTLHSRKDYMLLNHMINMQRNIGGFFFKHNNINTQGTNNEFGIDVS